MTDKKKKTAVLAFGRMNPPTTGHEKLINRTHQVAKKHGGTAHVVASHSHDSDKNPLPQDKKLGYLRKVAHPDVNVSGSSKEHPSILHHAAKLHAAGHSHLVVVAGGGREKEFHKTLNQYNGKKSKHGHYNFKSIKVVSSGKRDPDSHGTEGISGTKMRHYARSGQHDKFKQGLPKALHAHAKEIHGHVAGGPQLKEQAPNKLKRFKLSGEKTKIILHLNPSYDRSDKRYGYTGKKGSPANNTRPGGSRFGEGRVDNRVLSFGEDVDINDLFELTADQHRTKMLNKLKKFDRSRVAAGQKPIFDVNKKKTPPPQKEEIDPHIKTMIANGDSDKKIKKMHPEVTNDELKKLRENTDLVEVLSRQARIKKALILRRFKHKIQRRKKMMRKKLATKEMINRRARRHAVKLVRKRFMGKKGENYHNLGMSDKIIIDKKVAQKKKIIDRIAQRLLPKVRRAELVRLRSARQGGKSGTASYTMGRNVKSEGYEIINEDNIFDVVDNFYTLTEKDLSAMEKKINKSDIDPNILFEVFAMGLAEDGDGTPQQKGFHSLNVFVANINEDKEIEEAMGVWDNEPIQGVELDRRYNRPLVKRSTMPRLKEFKATGEDSFVADPVDPKKIDWKDSHTLAAYKMGKGSSKGKKNPFHKKNDPEGQLHTCWNMGNRGDKIPEALEYPHQTAKKYKKDTPGQQVKELNTSTLRSYHSKAADARGHRGLPTKKVDNRYTGVKRASDRLDKRNKERANEDAMDDAITAIKKLPSTDEYKKRAEKQRARNKDFQKWMKDRKKPVKEAEVRLSSKFSDAERERRKKKVASLTTDADRKRNRAAIDAARKARAAPDAKWGFPKKESVKEAEVRTGDIQLQKFRDPQTGKIKMRKVKRLAHGRVKTGRSDSGETGEGEVGGRGMNVEDTAADALNRARMAKNAAIAAIKPKPKPTATPKPSKGTLATARANRDRLIARNKRQTKLYNDTTSEDAGDAAVAKARQTIQQGRLKLQQARQKNRNDATRERAANTQKQRHKARYNAAKANEAFERFMNNE